MPEWNRDLKMKETIILEKGKNVYFFATNIDIRNQKDTSIRIELTRCCLKDLGLLSK